jgi:hypothetical protein
MQKQINKTLDIAVTTTFPKYKAAQIQIIEIEKYRIPKESPTRQNFKCCRLGLIVPVHGQKWKVQVTVHAGLKHRLK